MAGNIKGDNSGNIYVEFDYNNLIVVDPNKTIDSFGRIRERLVDHENLVMYANLEAEVLPRTKLAVGATPEDRIRLVSVAKMNFLKPTKQNYLGTGYYDELTGENTTKFRGQNQMMARVSSTPDGTSQYIIDSPADLTDVLDNGLLGITNISIDTGLSFVPSVRISLEDVQGRALFQLGNNSPYAAFFNLPYPPFYLTLKGFYGQAVRYQLNLEKFNARFNTFSGNYQIDLDFKGYKFNILNEISVGSLIATPHMYAKQFSVSTSPTSPQQSTLAQQSDSSVQTKVLNVTDGRKTQDTVQLTSERGTEKIREVYSEYKAKGIIPPDFPELSLMQFMNKIEVFEQNIANQFTKVEVEPLTNIRNYKTILKEYFNVIRGSETSWFNRYMNPAPLILKSGERVYVFKELDKDVRERAKGQLSSDIVKYNKGLSENPTLGRAGLTPIVNPITYKTIAVDNVTFQLIDWVKTTQQQTGVLDPTSEQIRRVQESFGYVAVPEIQVVNQNNTKNIEVSKPDFFIFEGNNRFDSQINLMEVQANKKLSTYEDELTKKLLEKIENSTVGIGFKPTVRNIIAIIMASAEAFIRLLDDVHTNAWNLKYDEVRKKAILYNPSSAPGSDTLDDIKLTKNAIERATNLKYSEIPVYPWPQFFVETPEDKKGRFQLKYIADPSVSQVTQGWDYSKWPEVEFVEEYIKGLTLKSNQPTSPEPLDNQRDTNLININPIEFPTTGVAYANKEEIKFFYEIWERQFLTSRYSNFIRANRNQIDELIKLNTETEVNNIKDSLGLNSPYITMKLKNYGLNSSNYLEFLQNISNQGTGRSWQDYIRDIFVTPYIKNLTENSFGILSIDEYGKQPQVEAKSNALRSLVTNPNNEPNITDTLPFTDNSWVRSNMADGTKTQGSSVYNTNKVLTIFELRKIIANFNDINNVTEKRPVTNFSYRLTNNPYFEAQNVGLTPFYKSRVPGQFVVTEGYYRHIPPGINFGLNQEFQFPILTTTSMLNTPYMVNSIQNGVENERNGSTYPYVQAAYLFINSLPMASLKEKYKSFNDGVTTELDYIASCFKKFGAIHKLPYAWILKYGSIWHRYKTYKQTGGDILQSAWKNFDYITNYSPILSSITQTYKYSYNQVNTDITLQQETSDKITIQTGFYPKVINDFYKFCTGYEVYKDYTNEEIQNTINGGMKVFNFSNSNINATQGDKTLNVTTRSVLIPGIVIDTNGCNTDNTRGAEYFIVPSFGSQINQTFFECFDNLTTTPTTKVNLTSNNAMYNGSVRLFWGAPNYGYFDNSQTVLPDPESYLNKIDSQNGVQTPFYLLNQDEYSKIEEVFGVFDKRILDLFETEFLNFCKPMSNIDLGPTVSQIGRSNVNLNANFRNFQSLFKSLITVNAKPTTQTDNEYYNGLINGQFLNIQNTLQGFLEYDVLFKYGNPSNYKRRTLDSYLSHQASPIITEPITFKPYVSGTLPSRGGTTTLQQSRALNPEAWRTLETEVGFSTIENVRYSSQGSYITDFFIDNDIEFTSTNIQLLNQIIKMYATYKLKVPTSTPADFKNQIQFYINSENLLLNNFMDGVLSGLNKVLPNQFQIPQGTVQSAISGEQSKVETWEIFKALNDKWIAGGDYKTKTLYEDILFLDRASRNIGQTILIDIFDLKTMLNENSLNNAMSVFTLISSILIKNNFTVMNLPAYVNFYNVQEVDGTTIPQPEGSLEFADNMWGTFLNVDYRNSAPKMVCFYVGKPSQYLDLPKGNFRFRDDGFEMRRASENPLIENLENKKDWSISNKCVGFNVDMGNRNQNVFYSFSVEQSPGVATSESINTMLDMVNQASGRNVATQNNSLYNLYKNRSYKCSVTSFGNAMLQPSMYFNLRHVPMFNGPYMIQSVQHAIQPGSFQTTFTGIRQGIFDLPSIDKFLQSMNQNLLTRLEEVLKINKDTPSLSSTTESIKALTTVQNADNKLDAQNSCTSKVDLTIYRDYDVQPNVVTEITPTEFARLLNNRISGNTQDDKYLKYMIYTISYVNSFVKSSNTGAGKFVGYNNNYALISLDKNFKPTFEQFFEKRYCCVNVKTTGKDTSLPIVSFKNVQTYIDFMGSRLRENLARIRQLTPVKYYACYWPNQNISESYFDSNLDSFRTLRLTFTEGTNSAVNLNLIGQNEAKEENRVNRSTSGTNTPTSTPIPPNPGQTCSPPQVSSFAPTIGNTGTIIQITGVNLESTTGVTINGVQVKKENILILDSKTLRATVPQVGTVQSTGTIKVSTFYGSSTSILQFKFDPTIQPSQASSPGSFVNGASNSNAAQNSVNTNPQNTSEITMLGTTVQLNESKTESLNVKINPQTTGWSIVPNVEMNYTVYELVQNGGTTYRKTITTQTTTLNNQVVNSEFNITLQQVESIIPTNIPRYQGKTQIDIVFVLKATKSQQTSVVQQFPFKLWYTLPNQTQVPNTNIPTNQTQPTFPPQNISLIKVGDFSTINGNGPQFYNIKKPAGGYVTYKLETEKPYQENFVNPPLVLNANTYQSVDIRYSSSSSTNYTNEIIVDKLGEFKLKVEYYPYGFTSPIGGQVLKQTIISLPFIL